MAVGDTATAAGIPLTSGSAPANTLETEINALKDIVGEQKLNNPRKISTGATAPTTPSVGDVWIKVS
nr:hypothetical protein [Microbacterium lemovicicum]